MKIVATRESLSTALNLAQNICTSKAAIEITGSILLSADQAGAAKLTSTNIDQTMESWFEAEVVENGAVALPGKKIIEIVKKFEGGQKITITADVEKKKAVIKAGRARFEVPAIDPTLFPATPKYEKIGKVSLPAPLFKEMAATALVAVAADSAAQPVLSGVLFELADGKISFVATDARRMSYSQYDIPVDLGQSAAPALTVKAVIPAKAIIEILRAAEASKTETIDIALAEKLVAAKCGYNIVTTRLIDGDFPDYKRVMKVADPVATMTIKAKEFSTALGQIECMAQQKSARFIFDENKITIEAKGEGAGSGEVVVDAQGSGKVEALYSVSLIREFFEVLSSEKSAVWQVPSGKTAAAIESGNTKYIVMPMVQ